MRITQARTVRCNRSTGRSLRRLRLREDGLHVGSCIQVGAEQVRVATRASGTEKAAEAAAYAACLPAPSSDWQIAARGRVTPGRLLRLVVCAASRGLLCGAGRGGDVARGAAAGAGVHDGGRAG